MTWNQGNNNPGAKLTEDEVRMVRRMAADGAPYPAIIKALDHRITKAAISLIVRRRTWKDIE